MSEYKPTFKVSPERRSLVQRLTPAAWALIGVGVVVVVLLVVAAVLALGGRRTGEVWQPTPTASPVPTATSVLPTPTPTAWYEGMISPTPEPTPAFPAWWSDQMTQDAQGRWWPPEGVREMVEEYWPSYTGAYRAAAIDNKPPDYEALEQVHRDWAWNWVSLVEDANLMREGIKPLGYTEWETCQYQVQDWSADGLECTLGVTCQNGTRSEYDGRTGDLLRQEHRDSLGLLLIRLRYDPAVGHWKQVEVVEYVPPPQ